MIDKTDLSEIHGLIGDLFPNLSAKEAWDQYKLSDSQVAHYQKYGYISHIKILEDHEIEVLRLELKSLMDPANPKHDLFYEFHSNESDNPTAILFHSLGHWRISEGFHDLLWNPRFVVPASQLLGTKTIRFWHDQLFCKPAKHGGVVAWHQDYSYWTRTVPLQHLTCWIGLDDSTKANGCLHYIPSSHTWDLLEPTDLANNMNGIAKNLNTEQKEMFNNPQAIEMPKGFGTFHHPLLVHGSYQNNSPNSRRGCVLNVFADGTRSNTNKTLLGGVPIIEKGEKMEGQFFPVLFDPKESK